ncbi:16S rRNA processing protein RimM [Anoxybacillus sp. B7M1]|jgi:16S rRNA processing protein RimM|uniref:ribosome maturation factor RimM n=1 Tax=unclassified Anoxybacillus TaxID=2639704 RepID=UPI0005CCF442|nr:MULTISPECIES: ribosome maturation factor RimM [unclassified Anoxybacillus]ANB56352.1 16S rRNA processing protein RimM [Anoxybacillus sp. B2M1]ANB66043.1 16S rRNA processing protein RimM [Anoxybacillus sp. B7M1]
MTKWFHVGTIVNTHGIRGEVRVVSKTDFAEERYKIGNLLYVFMNHSSEPIEVKVKSHRVHKSFDLLSFEGYDNINLVEKFKGAALKVPESQLGQLGEGEYYFHEIIGCTVITEEGETIGIVKEILTPGANDVWVVKRKNEKDALIPYIDDVVIRVNPEEKKITIRPMEGLLE